MSGGVRSTEERLSAYLDGELPDRERAELERALAEDEGLRRHLAELAALDELARERPEDVVPEGYFETLPGRVRARLPRRRAGSPRWVWPVVAAAVIAAALPALRRTEAPPPEVTAPSRSASRDLASPPPEPASSPIRTTETRDEPAATVPTLAAPPPESDSEREPEIQPPPTRPLRRPARRLAAAPEPVAEGRAPVDAGMLERGGEGEDGALAALRRRDATTLEELRQLREAWRAFVDLPGESGDEARVRVVELGLEAYRSGDDPVDLRQARRDAATYLAGQSTPRVEGLRRRLEELE